MFGSRKNASTNVCRAKRFRPSVEMLETLIAPAAFDAFIPVEAPLHDTAMVGSESGAMAIDSFAFGAGSVAVMNQVVSTPGPDDTVGFHWGVAPSHEVGFHWGVHEKICQNNLAEGMDSPVAPADDSSQQASPGGETMNFEIQLRR